jgi:hypothetical protein
MVGTTRRWLRRGMALGMLLLSAATLSACIETSTTSTIGPDFKGTTNMRIGISKTAVSTIAALGSSLSGTPTPDSGLSDQVFGDLTTEITQMGGSAKPYESADFVGVEITMQFSSLDEMQNQINSLLGGSSDSSNSSSPLGSGGPNQLVQITAKDTGSSLRIDGTVDPLSELNDASGLLGPSSGIDLSALLTNGGKVELSFTMPGAITSADPLATQNGTTVSWSFKVGDKMATIFVESNKS